MPQSLKTLLQFFALCLIVFVISRLLIRSLPGDPIEFLIAETGSRIDADALRHELHLDRPLIEGLGADLVAFASGDWGKSLINRVPVTEMIAPRFFRSVWLGSISIFLALSMSLFLGVLAGSRQKNSPRWSLLVDRMGAVMAALPTPWIGPIMIYIFAVALPIVPPSGSWILPSIALALNFSAYWSRLIRVRLESSISSQAATAARARGVSETMVTLKYGLGPVSGALLAYLGSRIGSILGGTMITEIVFGWDGLGRLMLESVLSRDYPLFEACFFVTSTMILAGHFLGEALQRWFDPRIS